MNKRTAKKKYGCLYAIAYCIFCISDDLECLISNYYVNKLHESLDRESNSFAFYKTIKGKVFHILLRCVTKISGKCEDFCNFYDNHLG